ncbi:hypothetical protein GUJ93_ZPchr0006g45795 [Zizania palustris]|uniref:DUF4220 domain-containing protein n=1 Tax=Zizania palustris TaxID=103762 RepID=A0A8J5VKB9_ZIZPA|nr:hypothetical protein GUJ93_ZPchr0006g45795 [Zizania palustris]
MAEGMMHILDQWAIEILVLLSFSLQLVLLVFAGFRRSGASAVLKLVVWPAYQLADFIATFTIGHLSVSDEHQLVAFWTPFLLLHLGGPDNITAYSLADNQLWKRQLLFSLVPQVLGAAYVVYKSFTGRRMLLSAALLVFAVGVLKYGERTWALKHANLNSIRSSVNVKTQPHVKPQVHHYPNPASFPRPKGDELEEEELLVVAHSLFHICKRAIADSSVESDSSSYDSKIFTYRWKEMCKVVEMELSLMYDILYTKAAVIHTWFGYSIRVISPPAVVVALCLFHFHVASGLDSYRKVDVAISYVLLVSAFLLETTSLFRAFGSTWIAAFFYTTRCVWLRHEILCKRRWDRIRRVAAFLRWLVNRDGHRWWAGTMGQFNMLHLCTRDAMADLRDAWAGKIGLWNLWKERHYTSKIVISEDVKELLFGHLQDMLKGVDSYPAWKLDAIRTSRGEYALWRHGLYYDFVSSLGTEFQQGIVTWHVATDIYLSVREEQQANANDDDVAAARLTAAVRALSNYMLFLLAVRPDMLPGLVLRTLYQVTCDELTRIWREHGDGSPSSWCLNVPITKPFKLLKMHDDPSSSRLAERKKLARIVLSHAHNHDLFSGALLAKQVLLKEKELLRTSSDGSGDLLRVIFEVWVEMLLYAGNRCSREAQAKQLNSGGELITVVWLLAQHAGLFRVHKTKQNFNNYANCGAV